MTTTLSLSMIGAAWLLVRLGLFTGLRYMWLPGGSLVWGLLVIWHFAAVFFLYSRSMEFVRHSTHTPFPTFCWVTCDGSSCDVVFWWLFMAFLVPIFARMLKGGCVEVVACFVAPWASARLFPPHSLLLVDSADKLLFIIFHWRPRTCT
jgi:hypothetical protein